MEQESEALEEVTFPQRGWIYFCFWLAGKMLTIPYLLCSVGTAMIQTRTLVPMTAGLFLDRPSLLINGLSGLGCWPGSFQLGRSRLQFLPPDLWIQYISAQTLSQISIQLPRHHHQKENSLLSDTPTVRPVYPCYSPQFPFLPCRGSGSREIWFRSCNSLAWPLLVPLSLPVKCTWTEIFEFLSALKVVKSLTFLK